MQPPGIGFLHGFRLTPFLVQLMDGVTAGAQWALMETWGLPMVPSRSRQPLSS